MRVLVTGGAGFIGSHIVDNLLDRDYDVCVLDDLSGGMRKNVDARATFVEGSVIDTVLIHDLFAEYHYDYVFHLAAYAAENLSHNIRRFNYTNNLVGSMNLINASIRRGVRCFVFTSSIAVYGSAQTPMHESLTPHPEDPYGIAKYAVELDLAAAHRHFGLNYIVFRPHNVYGERQNIADPCRNVIGIFMNQILHGQPCTIFGDGKQTRAFTHISDVAPVIAGSIERSAAYNEVYNIGANEPCSVLKLANLLQEILGATGIERHPARDEVLHAFCDHYKLKSAFNAQPRMGLVKGLRAMAAWAKKLGPQVVRAAPDLEIERALETHA